MTGISVLQCRVPATLTKGARFQPGGISARLHDYLTRSRRNDGDKKNGSSGVKCLNARLD